MRKKICNSRIKNRNLCKVRDELIRKEKESRKENNIIFTQIN